jgi:hypothetical protein
MVVPNMPELPTTAEAAPPTAVAAPPTAVPIAELPTAVAAVPTNAPIAELLSITKEPIMKTYDDYEL